MMRSFMSDASKEKQENAKALLNSTVEYSSVLFKVLLLHVSTTHMKMLLPRCRLYIDSGTVHQFFSKYYYLIETAPAVISTLLKILLLKVRSVQYHFKYILGSST